MDGQDEVKAMGINDQDLLESAEKKVYAGMNKAQLETYKASVAGGLNKTAL